MNLHIFRLHPREPISSDQEILSSPFMEEDQSPGAFPPDCQDHFVVARAKFDVCKLKIGPN